MSRSIPSLPGGKSSEGLPILTVDDLRAALGGPEAKILSIFGSVDLHHPCSEALCASIGRRLAEHLPDLTLATGANAAVHDRIARSFIEAVSENGGREARVFHLAPVGYHCDWTHGTVLHVGRDMAERRELLARVGDVAVSVEGGPGTADEMSKAWLWGVPLIPLGRSGGASSGMFDAPSASDQRPGFLDEKDWKALWNQEVDPDVTAQAVANSVKGIFKKKMAPK